MKTILKILVFLVLLYFAAIAALSFLPTLAS